MQGRLEKLKGKMAMESYATKCPAATQVMRTGQDHTRTHTYTRTRTYTRTHTKQQHTDHTKRRLPFQ